MKNVVLIFMISILIAFNGFSQNKLEANIGLGVFEGFSIKAKYGENIQIGISQGFFMNSLWLSGLEGYYHFTGDSKYTDQKTFYFMLGASSNIFTKGYDTFENIIIYPRIGRTINFSSNIGLNVDAGLALLMSYDVDRYASLVIPSGSIHLFVRF